MVACSDLSSVLEQVKYLGLGANIDVRKTGFVYRREFDKFLSRYIDLLAIDSSKNTF